MDLRTKDHAQQSQVWYSQATRSLNGQQGSIPPQCCDWLSLMTTEEPEVTPNNTENVCVLICYIIHSQSI